MARGEELAFQCGGHEASIVGWGTKIPHAMEQLSPRSSATAPERSEARMPQLRPSAAKEITMRRICLIRKPN